ncbi:MAG TPA: acetylornithine deacetylase [Geminicoccaceae bacterium]|nr:acetylornithine deacetylase [Geminicoccus sp.]HMU52343.1 acetylornithine deacetylase [Geminicoccaceae bacterium]
MTPGRDRAYARRMSQSLDILRHLVAFDTTSRNSNLGLIGWVRDFLAGHGVASALVHDTTGTKANLLATIGPAAAPGIVLSGHTDVVPVDGQDWTVEPFRPTVRDGRLYGRGTTDMKGFLACALAAVPAMKAAALRRPFHLAFSFDEEIGCKGVPALLARLGDLLPVQPMGCIVGEPTGMRLVDGHKGKAACRCTVRGRAGHSALTQEAVNAVTFAGRLIAWIDGLARDLAERGPFADGFVPPHSTASLGRIEGGGQINIVPDLCRFELEFRTIPGEDPRALVERVRRHALDVLLPEMRRTAPEAAIELEEFMAYPGLAPAGGALASLLRDLTGDHTPGKVSYGTEAGLFAASGIPAIICGPGHMSVAHKPDEHIELSQLAACDRLLERLVARAAA